MLTHSISPKKSNRHNYRKEIRGVGARFGKSHVCFECRTQDEKRGLHFDRASPHPINSPPFVYDSHHISLMSKAMWWLAAMSGASRQISCVMIRAECRPRLEPTTILIDYQSEKDRDHQGRRSKRSGGWRRSYWMSRFVKSFNIIASVLQESPVTYLLTLAVGVRP